MDEWISRQHTLLVEAQESQRQSDQHQLTSLPAQANPAQVNPQDVAQQNEQEFVVEEILAHRGNHQRRSTMKFLVRWTGYDKTSNSWEPYKTLMHVDRLHEYLREQRMRSLIPREHK